jgi:ribosomal protein S18 acetylase RimI-like enzyme
MAITPLIREATEADAPALAELLLELQDLHVAPVPEIYRPIEMNGEILAFLRGQIRQERTKTFAAELDTTLVGYVVVRVGESTRIPLLTPRRFTEIDTLIVARRAQRHGIGRALMERAQQWGAEQGAIQAQLSVLEFNRGAI